MVNWHGKQSDVSKWQIILSLLVIIIDNLFSVWYILIMNNQRKTGNMNDSLTKNEKSFLINKKVS